MYTSKIHKQLKTVLAFTSIVVLTCCVLESVEQARMYLLYFHAQEGLDNVCVMIVGNKADLEDLRVVSEEAASQVFTARLLYHACVANLDCSLRHKVTRHST